MIKVLQSGFYSSIQDLGRLDKQDYGVPVSGAMDQRAALLSNTLLGNTDDAAVLEMTMVGPKLQFDVDTAIAITGASVVPTLNGKTIKTNTFVPVERGSILSFGRFVLGCRAYLAIKGGFKTELILGSRSMYPNISRKSRIQNGDILNTETANMCKMQKTFSHIKVADTYLHSQVLYVYKGPEFDRLSKAEKEQLFSTSFTVSKNNNRMAYQVVEPLCNTLAAIITSPVLPGTVQLTASGQLIILMRDCQTTGGYPRILQLTEVAINILSQKQTGTQFVFADNAKKVKD